MTIIDQLLDNATELQSQMGKLMQESCKLCEADIIDMNAQFQLYDQGINRVGVPIMDYKPYSMYTIAYKERAGQPYDRVTLRDEGDFHHGFFVTFTDEGFEISSHDYKTEWLVKKYGRQIFGLTDENAKELTEGYIVPELLDKMREILYKRNG
jgi:hypothetical protein